MNKPFDPWAMNTYPVRIVKRNNVDALTCNPADLDADIYKIEAKSAPRIVNANTLVIDGTEYVIDCDEASGAVVFTATDINACAEHVIVPMRAA